MHNPFSGMQNRQVPRYANSAFTIRNQTREHTAQMVFAGSDHRPDVEFDGLRRLPERCHAHACGYPENERRRAATVGLRRHSVAAMAREWLLRLVAGFAALGVIVFVAALARTFAPSQRAFNNAEHRFAIAPLQAGELQILELSGRRNSQIFIYLPTLEQTEMLKKLDEIVQDKQSRALRTQTGAYVFWGHGTRWGGILKHVSAKRIDEGFDRARNWPGGFLNQHEEVSYDYSGRTISNHRFTIIPNHQAENLDARQMRIDGNTLIVNLLTDC